MKIGPAIATAWIAAALLVGFETLWVVVLERDLPLGYFALTAALVFASASVVAVACAFTGEPPTWVAIALAAAGASLIWGLACGVLTAIGLALLLAPGRHARKSSAIHGVAVAVGLGVSAIVAPRLLARVPFVPDEPRFVSATLLGLLAIAVVGLIVVAGHRMAHERNAGRVALIVALGLLSLAGLPRLSQDPPSIPDVPAPRPATAPLKRPHVVLLVLDTVRADHLSLYGYARETTPRLQAFFEARPNAVAFPSVYANANWTVPSHASLFTGLQPAEHGAHFGSGSTLDFGIGDHPTLAERMQATGYHTAGFYANPWLGVVDGFDRGFDVYRSPFVAARLPVFGEALRRAIVPGLYPEVIHGVPRADAILSSVESEILACGDRPCFVFANLIDAHSFYVADHCRGRFAEWSPRERITLLAYDESPARIEHLKARYDEEICDLDHRLGEMLERLEGAGVLDDSWIFITSDHGEAFGDHGNTEHGTSAYNDQVWIPLLVIPPVGTPLEATTGPAGLIDVTATIAAIGGAESTGAGRDLRAPAPAEATATVEFYGDESKRADQNPRAADPARAVAIGGYKLVDQSGRLELFDLRVDPGERVDLAGDHPELVARLRERLPELRFASPSEESEDELSPEMRAQLRELGYGR